MALEMSAFSNGDDYIGFGEPSPKAGPSRSSSPTSASPPSPKGKARADTLANRDAHDRKRKGKESELPSKRARKDFGDEVGPRNLKEERRANERAAPWAEEVDWERCADPAEMLNDEIHAFYRRMSPTQAEYMVRKTMIDYIAHVVKREWRDAEVIAFGSWQTQLYLPTGDIDLVVSTNRLTETNKEKMLRELARMVRMAGLTKTVAVISRAKVPIIKFVTEDGNLNVDISLNQTNGVSAGKIMRHYLDAIPGARELILIVKAFLSQRSMNEVYTGGLGSYSVICLVLSFLQQHPKLRNGEIDARNNLGTLLLEFFELYGRNFNYDAVGISLRHGGYYFLKRSRGWNRAEQSFLLSIEDPQDPDNDISRSSFGIRQVKMTLSGAYDLLQASLFARAEMIAAHNSKRKELPDAQEMSILGAVMGVTKETSKFRRELETIHQSQRVQRKLAAALKRDGAQYSPRAADPPRPLSPHRDPRHDDIEGDNSHDRRRTPSPPRAGADSVNAIVVDDDSDMSLQSDSSQFDSGDLDSGSDFAPTPNVRRFASVSEDGEVAEYQDDSRYTIQKSRKTAQSGSKSAAAAGKGAFGKSNGNATSNRPAGATPIALSDDDTATSGKRARRRRRQPDPPTLDLGPSTPDVNASPDAKVSALPSKTKSRTTPRAGSVPLPSRSGSRAGSEVRGEASCAKGAKSAPASPKRGGLSTAAERRAFWAAKASAADSISEEAEDT